MATEQTRPVRLIVLGTGDFALPTFDLLAGSSHPVIALVTQPDRPQGRKQEVVPSRIKRSAAARGIAVLQPEDVNAPEGLEMIRGLGPDLLVTAAYGQILSAELLTIPPMGGINLHGSILPAYRGAAPVARAIQNGERETGVTVIRMSPKIDAGGMIAFASTPIGPDETAGELEGRLAALGAPLVLRTIDDLVAGRARIHAQDPAKVTKAPKLRKEDGQIDWTRPALSIHNLVRAMQPWPLASTQWTPDGPGKAPIRLILHRTSPVEGPVEASTPPGTVVEASGDRLVVAAGRDALRILEIQIPGKRAMPAADFLRGNRLHPGDLLG
ncbi:Methionyl-tRNA formyltransferase [Aquisphaera giovannonii]|uniref:Methionyl-tRNA formyltransferase n=1 Tax=Aquisphaera giovannonii TaxID=406548 RepID=A0A5B9VWL5_9BACT|nr:methionyl-tRNA formyltransferase [Aquisphaera giovannonii]QEH32846.1 Methionyl-tRNA formyltransferase [Aquisphaera giovannonii]